MNDLAVKVEGPRRAASIMSGLGFDDWRAPTSLAGMERAVICIDPTADTAALSEYGTADIALRY